MTALPPLPPFIAGTRWFMPFGSGRLYCRYSFRDGLRCLDLADMELPEAERGQGRLTALLNQLEPVCGAAHGIQALHIESVLNPRLAKFLRGRAGYIQRKAPADPDSIAPSFLYRPESLTKEENPL